MGVTRLIEPADAPEERREIPLGPERDQPVCAKRIRRADQIGQIAVLVSVFAAPVLICIHKSSVTDPDVWWHLRAGDWILQHHRVPHTDVFSWTNAGKPWPAYSWLFELLIAELVQQFGLVGLLGYSAGMVLGICVAMSFLVRRLQGDFTYAAVLAFSACFSLERMFTPRPWLFTILFFVLELSILMQARKTGRTRELLWLPLIFWLWSNIHIEFIDGLIVLGIAAAEAALSRRGIGVRTRIQFRWLLAAFIGSGLATLVNPFGWSIYRIVFDYISRAPQSAGLNGVAELHSIPFRSFPDFLVLFFALAAAAALARNRRPQLFELGLLIFASVVSFHAQRDIWLMITVAVAILASSIPGERNASPKLPHGATTVALVAAFLVAWAGFRTLHVTNNSLQERVTAALPERAVDAIRTNGYAGPLYNDYNWGGYLMWALQMPVSIDGRGAFYSDEAIDRSVATWGGQSDWSSDPQLKAAGLVIGPAMAPLTQLLRLDPHFRLVYEDQLAAVFVAHR